MHVIYINEIKYFYGHRWNYNDVDVEIIWSCQIEKHKYYLVPIVCDNSFKIMIDSFIQNDLNMIILYMSSQPKSVFVPTSTSCSKSIRRGKNNLLLDDLLQMIDDTMFDNLFADQHI